MVVYFGAVVAGAVGLIQRPAVSVFVSWGAGFVALVALAGGLALLLGAALKRWVGNPHARLVLAVVSAPVLIAAALFGAYAVADLVDEWTS